MNNARRPASIAVVDDLYPHPLCRENWRGVELEAYLNHFPNMHIYTTLASRVLIDDKTVDEIMRAFVASSPSIAQRVSCHPEKMIRKIRKPDCFYFIFLNNAFSSLNLINRYRVPFIFTLYPGGGFARFNEESDQKLEKLMSSPYFRGVVVTSSVTKEYLLEKGFCSIKKVLAVWGSIFNTSYLQTENYPKQRFGIDKSSMDIVFAAMKYTEHGEDKGYDIFVKTARELAAKASDFSFHVVGNFDESTIDVSDLKSRIHFYGVQPPSFFNEFYIDKDIFISPNRPDVLAKGAFDGFPTGSAVDAIVRKTAAFCTDSAGNGQNCEQYIPEQEIEIITTDVSQIVDLVLAYHKKPEHLMEVGNAGAAKARILYSAESQITPRIHWIEKLLEEERGNFRYRIFSGLDRGQKPA